MSFVVRIQLSSLRQRVEHKEETMKVRKYCNYMYSTIHNVHVCTVQMYIIIVKLINLFRITL